MSKDGTAPNLKLLKSEVGTIPTGLLSLDEKLLEGVITSLEKAMVLAVSDSEGRFVFVSPSFLELSGFEASELTGQSHRIMNSNFHTTLFWKQMWEKIIAGESWRGEIRNKKKSGEYFWTDTTIVPVRLNTTKDFVFVEIRKDITLKKQKEVMLDVLTNIQKYIPQIDDKHTLFNKLLNDILHVTESEWVVGVEVVNPRNPTFNLGSMQIISSDSSFDPLVLSQDDYREFLKIFEPVIKSGRPLFIHQGHAHRRKQEILNPAVHKFSSFIGLPIQAGGQVLALIGLANRKGGYKESTFHNWQPISEIVAQTFEKFEQASRQKIIDKELNNHLILLEQSQEIAKIGGWTFDLENQEVYWTRQLYILFGCDPTVFKPTISSFSAFIDLNRAEFVNEKILGLVHRLEEFDIVVPVSSQFGASRWMRIFGRPQFDNGKVVRVSGAVQDVTLLKRQEQQVEDHRKKAMANSRATSLGQMAGGLAHEINNPLTIILGTAKHFKTLVDRNEVTAQIVEKGADKILTSTHRIAKVIKGLKAFAREGSKDPIVECSVQMIFDDTFSFCEARVRNHGIILEPPVLVNEPKMRCRPVEIAQALLNLILNSDFAVRGTPNAWIKVSFEQNSEFSIFRVTDSGNGISKDVADKMMEPFYTTKDPGLGMGLGLSVVHSIVVGHSGSFQLDSTQKNTSFVFQIPRRL